MLRQLDTSNTIEQKIGIATAFINSNIVGVGLKIGISAIEIVSRTKNNHSQIANNCCNTKIVKECTSINLYCMRGVCCRERTTSHKEENDSNITKFKIFRGQIKGSTVVPERDINKALPVETSLVKIRNGGENSTKIHIISKLILLVYKTDSVSAEILATVFDYIYRTNCFTQAFVIYNESVIKMSSTEFLNYTSNSRVGNGQQMTSVVKINGSAEKVSMISIEDANLLADCLNLSGHTNRTFTITGTNIYCDTQELKSKRPEIDKFTDININNLIKERDIADFYHLTTPNARSVYRTPRCTISKFSRFLKNVVSGGMIPEDLRIWFINPLANTTTKDLMEETIKHIQDSFQLRDKNSNPTEEFIDFFIKVRLSSMDSHVAKTKIVSDILILKYLSLLEYVKNHGEIRDTNTILVAKYDKLSTVALIKTMFFTERNNDSEKSECFVWRKCAFKAIDEGYTCVPENVIYIEKPNFIATEGVEIEFTNSEKGIINYESTRATALSNTELIKINAERVVDEIVETLCEKREISTKCNDVYLAIEDWFQITFKCVNKRIINYETMNYINKFITDHKQALFSDSTGYNYTTT